MTVHVNEERVRLLGEFLKTQEVGKPLNFYSYRGPDGTEIVDDKKFPPLDHPAAVDFFFAVVAQDFGFWHGSDEIAPRGRFDDEGYVKPVYGIIGGERLKGSDFLWAASRRTLDHYPDFFSTRHLADLADEETATWFADDSGVFIPIPQYLDRAKLSRSYARHMREVRMTPKKLLRRVNKFPSPLKTLIDYLTVVPGYADDPLRKKALLLAMALANRPEKFLNAPEEDPAWRPIIDYHLMRLALRIGLVDPGAWRPFVTELVATPDEEKNEIKVRYIPTEGERQIREATCDAISEVIRISGKTMSSVDQLLWMGRRYCPEMEAPKCGECPLAPACEKHVQLFQPCRRTTWY